METKDKTLRMGFPLLEEAFELDPLKIHLAPQYALLENLYSSLVKSSPDKGEPEASVAKSYYWKDKSLYLEIRDDLKTVDGYSITANDAAFSLKRYLLLKGGTHSDLSAIICGDEELKSIEDDCPGIDIKDNTLVLTPMTENVFFLLPMLTEMDFAVIPKRSVDPKTLKIVDRRNTSGPYYLDRDDDGAPILKSNKNHFLYNEEMPQTVKLVKTDTSENTAITLYNEGRVDFVTAADSTRPEKVIEYASDDSSTNLHMTLNIRTFVAIFTQAGIKRLSEKKRFALGKALKSVFIDYFSDRPGYEETSQFFPSFGDGGLNNENLKALESRFSSTEKLSEGEGITLSFVRFGEFKQIAKYIKDKLPGITIREESNAPAFTQYDSEHDMPDLFIGGPDTAFKEDIGLITYSLEAGFLKERGEGAQSWIKEYMDQPDKEERLKKLRELHKETLEGAYMVPLLSAPYASMVRKPWEIEFTQLHASNHLWLLNLR